MKTSERPVEMVYGIYFPEKSFCKGVEYVGPSETREAGIVINEQGSDEEIIKNLIASDFLYTFDKFRVIDNLCSIHIVNSTGRVELILVYEEDFE